MVKSLNLSLAQEIVNVFVLPGVLKQVHKPVEFFTGLTVQLVYDIVLKDVWAESQPVALSLT